MLSSLHPVGAAPHRRRIGALAAGLLLLIAAQPVAAAAPGNDLVGAPTQLKLGVAVDFDSTEATISPTDPTDCDGSHGAFPGPYYASVWFSYTAKSAGQLNLSAPTMQNEPGQFLAISFVYEKTASGLSLIDCTAYGNEASWSATPGTTYLIMEAGLDAAVTEEPEFSNRGGLGTVTITRSATSAHYSFVDRFSYDDCGFRVDVESINTGTFHLRAGHAGDPTPYLFDNYEWHSTTTNPANGKWFVEEGNGQYRDLKIANVEGTIYTFQAIESGRPYSLTDMDGNKLFFDRGRLLVTFQVDTKGDDDLSNDEEVPDSFELLADNGSHPAWHFDGDFCEIVVDLLG